MKHQRPLTAFAKQYADDLKSWEKNRLQGQSTIVAIARKAPRLIELAVREGVLDAAILSRVTTEHGFLFQVPETPLLCDDIIIHGSTFERVRDLVCAHSQIDHATLPQFPFAVADGVRERLPEVSGQIQLRKDDSTFFVGAEIASFAILGKPYEVDHPILFLKMKDGVAVEKLKDCFEVLAQRQGFGFFATPRHWVTGENSVEASHVWTITVPSKDPGRDAISLRKIRCYFDSERRGLVVVPISPRANTHTKLGEEVRRIPTIRPSWELAAEALRSNTSNDRLKGNDDFQRECERSGVIFANFLLELVDLGPAIVVIRDCLSRAGLLADSGQGLQLDPFDLQMLVGRELAFSVTKQLGSFVASEELAVEWDIKFHDFPLKPQIRPSYKKAYDAAKRALLEGCETIAEGVEAEFRAQHMAIEVPGRKPISNDKDRLEFGIPFSGLLDAARTVAVLQSLPFDPQEVHRAQDAFVDAGTIVPRFLCTRFNEEDIWWRSFRVGEGQGPALKKESAFYVSARMLYDDMPDRLRGASVERFLAEVFASDALRADMCAGPVFGVPEGLAQGEWAEWTVRKGILKKVVRGDETYYARRRDTSHIESERPFSRKTAADIEKLAEGFKPSFPSHWFVVWGVMAGLLVVHHLIPAQFVHIRELVAWLPVVAIPPVALWAAYDVFQILTGDRVK